MKSFYLFLLIISIFLIQISCEQKETTVTIISKNDQNTEKLDFKESAIRGFVIIFVSEIGDRTFFLTMIYAATNSFFKTFLVASTTMVIMNFLALVLGYYLPNLLNRNLLDWVGIIVFSCFGLKMLYDAYMMESHTIGQEFEEVKHEIEEEHQKRKLSHGHTHSHTHNTKVEDKELQEYLIKKDIEDEEASFSNVFTFITSLVVAELGDKSQISAVILGALHNFYGVLLGTSIGFVCCILAAILFGNFLAKTLTTKQLTYIAGFMFLIFAGAYIYEKFEHS
jgi:putative Ca2+/H+ antiporter (TMEM165/GDT1 family)